MSAVFRVFKQFEGTQALWKFFSKIHNSAKKIFFLIIFFLKAAYLAALSFKIDLKKLKIWKDFLKNLRNYEHKFLTISAPFYPTMFKISG